MVSINKNREKRHSASIGKESFDLIDKLKLISGNKKLTKKEIISRSLEHCYSMKLNLSETPEKPISKKDMERFTNDIINKIHFYNKDFDSRIKALEKK